MNVGLALLLVALGRETLQATGYVGEVGLECAFVGKLALQLGEPTIEPSGSVSFIDP